jgi:aminoglycoside 6'-N-acetyltransferase I
LNVRRVEPGDEELVAQVCRLFDDHDDDSDLDPEAFLQRPETVMFVVEDDSGACGCAYGHELVHPAGERTMLLYSLDVAESVRRRGYGVALVNALVDHARAIGCTEVWVLTDDANPAALATYSAAGGQRDPADQVMFVWPLR